LGKSIFSFRQYSLSAFPIDFRRVWLVLHGNGTQGGFHTSALFGSALLDLSPWRTYSETVIGGRKRSIKGKSDAMPCGMDGGCTLTDRSGGSLRNRISTCFAGGRMALKYCCFCLRQPDCAR
jgi:hypothetical protein